jgi:hypothetical protein
MAERTCDRAFVAGGEFRRGEVIDVVHGADAPPAALALMQSRACAMP